MYQQTPWALVTGASGELGQEISLALARQNIPLYLHYHQGEQRLQPVLAECARLGVPAYPIQADLGDPKQIITLFAQLPIKPLLLVNNAGIDHFGLVSEVSPELFDQLIAVNVRSLFFVTQQALPAMLHARFGRIVNVSSIWGQTGSACEVLYSLTKGAILSYTKALAKEVALNGITANAVAPGAIEGGMMRRFSDEEREMICEQIPAGRLGQATEVASLVNYLLSAEAGYITGQVVSANGGWYT